MPDQPFVLLAGGYHRLRLQLILDLDFGLDFD